MAGPTGMSITATVVAGFLKGASDQMDGTTVDPRRRLVKVPVDPRRRLTKLQHSKVGNGGKILRTRAPPVPAVAPLKKNNKVTDR